MKDIDKEIKNIASEFTSLVSALNLREKRGEVKELEKSALDPNFWDDRDKAKKIMLKLGELKKEVTKIDKLSDDIKDLRELSKDDSLKNEIRKEAAKIKREVEKLKVKSLLSGVHDRKSALVGIHAGQGGTEAMDWASMLYRMYLRYCERRDWQTEVLDLSAGEEAGIKSVTFKVSGSDAYGYLKNEAGTHRLVRQSPFNADKLRHTSFALVEVLPELEEVDLPDIEIKESDLDWQFFRASTQGGQNVQKVSTAVRLKHRPSGITVTSQTERHQEQNRKIALNLLRSRVWLAEQVRQEEKRKELKGEYRPASWGNQIRSYVLHPYKMIKDLRTNVETSDTEGVLDGKIDKFIEAELKLKST